LLRSRQLWLGILGTALFLGLFFWRTDLGDMADALADANYLWFAPAIAVWFVSAWFRSLRWRYLLRPIADLPARTLYPVVVIGYMANNLLPARTGELVRAYIMGERHRLSLMATLGTISVERLFDGLVLLAFLVFVGAFVGLSQELTILAIAMSLTFVAVFAVFLYVVLVMHLRRVKTVRPVDLQRGLRREQHTGAAFDRHALVQAIAGEHAGACAHHDHVRRAPDLKHAADVKWRFGVGVGQHRPAASAADDEVETRVATNDGSDATITHSRTGALAGSTRRRPRALRGQPRGDPARQHHQVPGPHRDSLHLDLQLFFLVLKNRNLHTTVSSGRVFKGNYRCHGRFHR